MERVPFDLLWVVLDILANFSVDARAWKYWGLRIKQMMRLKVATKEVVLVDGVEVSPKKNCHSAAKTFHDFAFLAHHSVDSLDPVFFVLW